MSHVRKLPVLSVMVFASVSVMASSVPAQEVEVLDEVHGENAACEELSPTAETVPTPLAKDVAGGLSCGLLQ